VKRITIIVVGLVAVAAAACAPPPPVTPGHTSVYITRDAADVYQFTPTADGVQVTAPGTNIAGNTRTMFWSDTEPRSVDQQVCATFQSDAWPAQEGVSLRTSNGRAITVMKNIWGRAVNYFNVQLIDMSRPADQGRIAPPVPGVDFGHVLSGAPQPWRLCAKVEGQQLTYKVFPANQPEPAWGDQTYGRTVVLAPDWVYEGQPGIYIGHLNPGGWATFSNVTTGTL
jgi:hypothetical protein